MNSARIEIGFSWLETLVGMRKALMKASRSDRRK
jgi:hypothetical protein